MTAAFARRRRLRGNLLLFVIFLGAFLFVLQGLLLAQMHQARDLYLRASRRALARELAASGLRYARIQLRQGAWKPGAVQEYYSPRLYGQGTFQVRAEPLAGNILLCVTGQVGEVRETQKELIPAHRAENP